jgi:hypothetical protein
MIVFIALRYEVAHNLGSETKRATGMPLFGAIGQTGSILGSQLYPLSEGPTYSYVQPIISELLPTDHPKIDEDSEVRIFSA